MGRLFASVRRALPCVGCVVAWTAVGFAVVALLALAVLTAFLGKVVDPFFYVFPAAIVGGLIGVACWVVWDLRRSRAAARAGEATAVVDVEERPAYRPPPPVHGFSARWWRKVRGRRRVKEPAR